MFPGLKGCEVAHDGLISQEGERGLRHDADHVGHDALVEAPPALPPQRDAQHVEAALVMDGPVLHALLQPRPHHLLAKQGHFLL